MKNGVEKAHGDGLNSKREIEAAELHDFTVFHEPVKDKPPAAVAWCNPMPKY